MKVTRVEGKLTKIFKGSVLKAPKKEMKSFEMDVCCVCMIGVGKTKFPFSGIYKHLNKKFAKYDLCKDCYKALKSGTLNLNLRTLLMSRSKEFGKANRNEARRIINELSKYGYVWKNWELKEVVVNG